MISLARRTATERNLAPQHVVFVQATLASELPILPDSIDRIISTWSISQLVPDVRERLLTEIFRVVKVGGRIVFKDVSVLLLNSQFLCERFMGYCRPSLSHLFQNLYTVNWLQTPYTHPVFMAT